MSILEEIISVTDVGLPLGFYTSQWLANWYLQDLDHFIKERLKIRGYIRYMDDFILIHESKDYLRFCREEIRKKLEAMGFELHQKKTVLHPLRQGVTFLQWRFVLTETGKVLMLMNSAKLTKQRRRMRKLWEKEKTGKVRAGTVHDSFQAFLANAERGNSWKMRESMKQFYKDLTGDDFK